MKFLDTFSGIGGFRIGMEAAGHECIGYVEIDKFARKSYEAIHDTKGEWTAHDITRVTDESIRELKGVDVICGGFPCQAFSVAGKRGGFSDTRGTLFFEIARFANILRPRYLFLENVTGLLSHDNGNTFETILGALDEIGYDAEWSCINSKRFVPQNRERVFIIGHSRAERTRKIFPIGSENTSVIEVVGRLEGNHDQNSRVYGIGGVAPTLRTMQGGGQEPKILISATIDKQTDMNSIRLIDVGKEVANCIVAREYKGIARSSNVVLEPVAVLTPDRAEKRQNGRRFKEPGEPMFTLTSQDRHGVAIKQDDLEIWDMYNKKKRTDGNVGTLTANGNTSFTHSGTFGISDGYRIRKLTPRECFRLQGFPDYAFNRATEVNSDSQLYRQAGNSVTVPVIYEIARRLSDE